MSLTEATQYLKDQPQILKEMQKVVRKQKKNYYKTRRNKTNRITNYKTIKSIKYLQTT